MNLNIKLYGTLSRSIEGYDHLSGFNIDLSDESTIDDLLTHLKINPKRGGMILMNGKPIQAGTRLVDNGQIKILQPIAGG